MSKKVKRIIIAASISIIFSILALLVLVPYLFSAQYNKKGVSHFLVITIDNVTPKTYIGVLEGHKIYVEKMNISETVFRDIKANNVSIKDALDKKLVSISDWEKYAFKVIKKGEYKILKYSNYEISCNQDECIIRPLTK